MARDPALGVSVASGPALDVAKASGPALDVSKASDSTHDVSKASDSTLDVAVTSDPALDVAMASDSMLDRLRAICLRLPEAVEKETWEAPTFRVRDKIFAMVHPRDGAPSCWCKAPSGAQAILVTAAPDRFFRPPYVGHKGWVGICLTPEPDWDEVAYLIARSYRMTAPKRLAGQMAER